MTVIALPTHGRWAWDARGDGRAVRVSTHADVGLVNVSVWREDVCVGTVRLGPADVAGLITGLSDGLAELAAVRPRQPGTDGGRLHELEARLTRLESRRTPVWRKMPAVVAAWTRKSPVGRR